MKKSYIMKEVGVVILNDSEGSMHLMAFKILHFTPLHSDKEETKTVVFGFSSIP